MCVFLCFYERVLLVLAKGHLFRTVIMDQEAIFFYVQAAIASKVCTRWVLLIERFILVVGLTALTVRQHSATFVIREVGKTEVERGEASCRFSLPLLDNHSLTYTYHNLHISITN